MMVKKVFIGIDVSKLKFDLCVRIGDTVSQELVLSNTASELKSSLRIWLKSIASQKC
jgi:hypothetical protein